MPIVISQNAFKFSIINPDFNVRGRCLWIGYRQKPILCTPVEVTRLITKERNMQQKIYEFVH